MYDTTAIIAMYLSHYIYRYIYIFIFIYCGQFLNYIVHIAHPNQGKNIETINLQVVIC